jgi:hypothetical protein
VEGLESRELLTFTPLGTPLPDLVVHGGVPPLAAYGGSITVTADVSNLSSSARLEPLALFPGAVSGADAGPSTVGVFISPFGGRNWTRRRVKLGDIQVPSVRQNSTLNLEATFAMPTSPPAGFPGSGGQVFVWFKANDSRAIREVDVTNNVSRAEQAVSLFAPLPQLALSTVTYPPSLSPGALIAPSFTLGNFGTVDTQPQAPVEVLLVASTDQFFGPTDVVLATYTFSNVAALSSVPSFGQTVLEDVNLDQPGNVVTGTGQIVTLPSSPSQYFIGYIIDPKEQIRQISDLAGPRSNQLQGLRLVQPPIHGMPALNQTLSTTPFDNVFPTPAFGLITSPFFPTNDTTTPTTAVTTSVTEVFRAPVITNVPFGNSAKFNTGLHRAGSNPGRKSPSAPRVPSDVGSASRAGGRS